jgi:hypothetical protein
MAAQERWGHGQPSPQLPGPEESGTQRYWIAGCPIGGLDAVQIAVPIADVNPGLWLNDLGTAVDLFAHCSDPNAGPTVFVISPDDPVDEAFEIELGLLGDPEAGTVTMYVRAKEVA